MTFTYTGDPSVSARDKVRFLIGDTISADPHFQDEEISWLLSEWSNDVYDAARAAAETLAGRYAHKANVSRSVGDLSISESYTEASNEFRLLAASLDAQKNRNKKPIPRINAASLKSTNDRVVTTHTTDFYSGIQDNN